MSALGPWLAAGRPARAALAPLAVAVGSSYAHFDEQPGPGLPAHALVTVAAFAAALGVNLIDHGWDSLDDANEARDSFVAGGVALVLAALFGLALVPLSGSAALGYGFVAVLVGIARRAPVVGFDGLGWGLGEVATVLALGPIAALAGFASQAGIGSTGAFFAGLPLGLIAASALFARHFTEKEADARLARVTPLVALGDAQARLALLAFPALAAAAVVVAARAWEYGPWAYAAAVPMALPLVAAWRLPESASRDDYERWERLALGCAAASLLLVVAALRLASPD